jgi:hypothetical protein
MFLSRTDNWSAKDGPLVLYSAFRRASPSLEGVCTKIIMNYQVMLPGQSSNCSKAANAVLKLPVPSTLCTAQQLKDDEAVETCC